MLAVLFIMVVAQAPAASYELAIYQGAGVVRTIPVPLSSLTCAPGRVTLPAPVPGSLALLVLPASGPATVQFEPDAAQVCTFRVQAAETRALPTGVVYTMRLSAINAAGRAESAPSNVFQLRPDAFVVKRGNWLVRFWRWIRGQ